MAGSNQAGKGGWLRYVFEYLNPDIIRYFAKPHIRRAATVDVVEREQGKQQCLQVLSTYGLSYLDYYTITNHQRSLCRIIMHTRAYDAYDLCPCVPKRVTDEKGSSNQAVSRINSQPFLLKRWRTSRAYYRNM